jgi:hypothetical protein
MKNWILDWIKYPHHGSGSSIAQSLRAGAMNAWEVEKWMYEKGVLTGVCFYRKELEPMKTMWIESLSP